MTLVNQDEVLDFKNDTWRGSGRLLMRDNQRTRPEPQRRRACIVANDAHHRIANHLTILESQTRLQARHQADEAGRLALEQVASQILAVARLHKTLMFDAPVAELGAHLHELCVPLVAALGNKIILTEKHTGQCWISPAAVLPVTQIVLEALTNALKYGRAADGVAAVTIHTRPDANRVQVVIADMGSGLPEGGQVRGQGARMMRVLAAQIGAELSFISGDGFEVALSIPAAQPHP